MKSFYYFFKFIQNQTRFLLGQKLAITLVLCLTIHVVHGGNYTWNGSVSSGWAVSSNWSPAGVPSNNDSVTISNGGVNSILLDGNRTITRLVISANTINLNTYELHVTGRSALNGGAINNGNLKIRGTFVYFQGTNFNCTLDVIVGQIKFSGGTFDQAGSFEQTGVASGWGDGGCTFNANVTIKNSGATTLRMGQVNKDIFNGDVTYTCTGTSPLQPAYSDSTVYNGNVFLNNSGNGGIVFCSGANGVVVLANGKTMGVGATGLTAGVNTLKNINQIGNTAQSIITASTLNITACTFNGSTTITAAGILVKGSTFNASATFTKTGNANNYWDGSNVFNGTTTINNNTTGNGVLRMALQGGDVYAGDVNFNTSTGPLQVAFVGTSEFKGNININHNKVVFNYGSGTVLCGGGNAQTLSGSADFAIGKLALNKSSNGITLQRAATIDSSLTLTKGIIFTDTINLVTLKAGSTCSGASNLSYINGPMVRYGASSFTYPIGSDLKFRPISVSASSLSTDALKMQFQNSTPLNSSTCDTTIRLGSCENWKVVYISNSKSRIFTISWDSLSCGVPRNSEIVVSGWNGSTWKNLGKSNISGGYLNGTATSNDSSATTSICLGTLKTNLSIDSVQFGELLDYSLYTRDSIILNEDIVSIGKVGADYISHNVSTIDSVMINFSGSTQIASNALFNMLSTLNSLPRTQLDTAQFFNSSLANGIYEINSDLYIDQQIDIDTNSQLIIFVKGKLILGENCLFSSIINPSKNVLFVTDSLLSDTNAFISASFISFSEFIQLGEMKPGKLSVFALNNITIFNDSMDVFDYSTYHHPAFKYQLKICTNSQIGCNLVLNPGFDEEVTVPLVYAGISAGECCNWWSPNNLTPDYYHQSSPPLVFVPTQTNGNIVSTQDDHGNYGGGVGAYSGIIVSSVFGPNTREYLQGMLASSLVQGQQYYSEFFAILHDACNRTSNQMGMFVSQNAPTSTTTSLLQGLLPQIEHNSTANITNSTDWTLINGCFTAQGGESFVTIGSFYSDAQTVVNFVVPAPNPAILQPYYFIDDVSVVPLEVNAGTDMTVACTGNVQIGDLNCLEDLNPGQFTYSWSLISGNATHGTLSSSNTQFPTFNATNTTATVQTHIYQVQITTPGGCTAVDQITITINFCCPSVTLTASPSTILCPGQSITISSSVVSGIAPYSYLWSPGSTSSPSLNVTTPGNYSVVVTDANGCTGQSSITITSSSSPSVPIITGSTDACSGSELYTITSPGVGLVYTWTSILPPGGSPSTFPCHQNNITFSPFNTINSIGIGATVTATFPSSQCNYLLQVVATNPNTGCSSSSTYPISWCCTYNTVTAVTDEVYTLHNTSISANSGTQNVGPTTLIPNKEIHIAGKLYIDVTTIWSDIDVTMYPGAEIIVQTGVTFSLRDVVFESCETFWKSITVMNNANITMYWCTLNGAQYGVDIQNGGSYIIGTGNNFLDCYTGIRVNGASAGSFLNRLIEGTDFSMSPSTYYNDLFDYNGQIPATESPNSSCVERPFAGIQLIDAGVIKIGRPSISNRMSIKDVEYGIRSIRSSPTIALVDFDNIQFNPCIIPSKVSGSGIFTSGIVNSTIINYPTPNHCTFTNCRNGIFAENVKLIAEHNEMVNTMFGIKLIDPPSVFTHKKSIINHNTIQASQIGIKISSKTGVSHFTEVNVNTITAFLGAPDGFGINWEDFIVSGKTSSINQNTITATDNIRYGINFLSHNDFNCVNNPITLDNVNHINSNGIKAGSCQDYIIKENPITATPLFGNSKGINITNSGSSSINNFIYCNEVTNFNSDFYFTGATLNVNWAGNKMNGGDKGLFMQNGVILNDVDPWNEWCGSFTSFFIDADITSFALWYQNASSSGGCITIPTQVNINGTNIIFNNSSGSDPGCPRPTVPIVNNTDQDRFVATDTNWSSMEENILWQYRRSLANKLVMNPDLLEEDSIINSFWWANQDLDEIMLAGLMKNVVMLDSLNKDNYGSIKFYSDSISDAQIAINYNDSLLGLGLDDEDSIRILEENYSYSLQISNWLDLSSSIYDEYKAILAVQRDSLKTLYSEYSPQTERGEVEKAIWELILTYGYGSELTVGYEDSIIISEYANLCMLEYGSAIGYIRSLYGSFTDLVVDDDDVCSSESRVANFTKENIENKVNFTILPNPSKDNVYIQTYNLEEQEYNIKILNLQGRLISKYSTSLAGINIDLENLQAGIYFVKLEWKDGSLGKKLVVIK